MSKTFQSATGPIRTMGPRDYASMANFLASDIDLSEATQAELNALFIEAIRAGWTVNA